MTTCMFCDKPSTRLCDNALAMVDAGETVKLKGQPAHSVTSMEAMLSHSYTCDAPFCDEHGRVVGHICGAVSDTIDHCAGCHGTLTDGLRLRTPEQIDRLRREMHAEYRRQRIREAGKGAAGV